MKQYVKDLTAEEVIERLKNGEIIRSTDLGTIEMIDGFMVSKRNNEWAINCVLGSYMLSDYYFDRPDPEMEIEVGKFYKTRGGNKAFVFAKNSEGKFNIAVEGGEAYAVFQGGCYSEEDKDDKDLIELWDKKTESKKESYDPDKLSKVKELLEKGYSYEEIAREFQTTQGSIASYIFYHRQKGRL